VHTANPNINDKQKEPVSKLLQFSFHNTKNPSSDKNNFHQRLKLVIIKRHIQYLLPVRFKLTVGV